MCVREHRALPAPFVRGGGAPVPVSGVACDTGAPGSYAAGQARCHLCKPGAKVNSLDGRNNIYVNITQA